VETRISGKKKKKRILGGFLISYFPSAFFVCLFVCEVQQRKRARERERREREREKERKKPQSLSIQEPLNTRTVDSCRFFQNHFAIKNLHFNTK
jgi:hypothetical protein